VALTIPATGTGTATPVVATDVVAAAHVQQVKILDGTAAQGTPLWIPPTRELVTTVRTSLFGDPFNSATGPDVVANVGAWVQTLAGTGSNAVSGGELQVATGSTASSLAQIVSRYVSRLLSGTMNLFTGHFRFTDGAAGTASNIRSWGAASTVDGFMFQLTASGLQATSRRAGTDTQVAHGSFSEGAYTLDANIHKYQILYSDSDAYFFIDNVLVHKLTAIGTAAPIINTTNLPILLRNDNQSLSGSTNVSLFCHNVAIFRLGEPLERPRSRHFITSTTNQVIKPEAGTLRRVIIARAGAGQLITLGDDTASSATNTIAVIDGATVRNIEFDLDFNNGLVITLANSTGDIVVVFD
jgi:hypothetical protein